MKSPKKGRTGPPLIPKVFRPHALRPEVERLPLRELRVEVPWDDWIPRIQRFAYWFLERYHWHGEYVHASVRVKIAEDAVMKAILAFLAGRRRFDSEEVDLFTFLCNSASSIIDAEAKRKEHQQVHAALIARGETRTPGTMIDDRIFDSSVDIDRQLLAKAYVRILKEGSTADQLAYIAILEEQDYISAKETARLLQWPVQKVQAVRRSIHRRFLRLLAGVTRPPRVP